MFSAYLFFEKVSLKRERSVIKNMQTFPKKIPLLTLIFAVFFSINISVYSAIIPYGKTVGIKLYTDGIIVTGISEFLSSANEYVCPAKAAKISKGDTIKAVNGKDISSSEDFMAMINGDTLNLKICRKNEEFSTDILPVMSKSGKYQIGLWVRDSTAGIGTISCYDTKTCKYYALGHAITDVDTGNIMSVYKGNIQYCKITAVNKGYVGVPGSLSGEFYGENLGSINNNTVTGISGVLEKIPDERTEYPIANETEITSSDAYIMTDAISDAPSLYSAKIEKINGKDDKNMIIKITDERLLNTTGGIVQGMSGSPILQNGRIVGAVTHVFVNDPTRGYGIFIENMLAEAEKIK